MEPYFQANSVIESHCPSMRLSVPLQNTHFMVLWRDLVEEHISPFPLTVLALDIKLPKSQYEVTWAANMNH